MGVILPDEWLLVDLCKGLYNIEKVESSEFSDTTWNIEKLPSYKIMDNKYKPFLVTLSELSQAAV